MAKHDCPYCRCDEVPEECKDGHHCMHQAGIWPVETWFCCRCSYQETYKRDFVTQDSATWPPPGCKLRVTVS